MKRYEHGSGVLLLTSSLLLAYAAIRATTVSFTYDECYTFLEHVRVDMFYLRHHDQMGGNHHLLNVWCMWGSWKLFGSSELALRLPSLLAYAVYLYASARIALRARSGLLVVGAFLLLNLHPYLIDFFSLARGYALANAFLMLSLWKGMQYIQDGKRMWSLVWAVSFAALAALAHVVMVTFILAFSGALIGMQLFDGWREGRMPWREVRVVAGINAVSLLIVLPNALGLFHGGSLNFGCNELWSCSMASLAEKILYLLPLEQPPLELLAKALWCCVVVCVVSVLVVWRSKEPRALRPFAFGVIIFSLCMLGFWLQKQLFDVPLPRARTALFLLPMVAFIVVCALQSWPRWTWMPGIASLAVCVPLVLLSYAAFNTRYVVEWRSTGEMRKALELVVTDRSFVTRQRPQTVVRAGFEAMGSMVYYANRPDMRWLAYGLRADTAFQPADYYLVEPDAQHLVDPHNWTRLFHSDITGLSLYRDERLRKAFTETVHNARSSKAFDEVDRSAEFSWTVPVDHPPKPALIVGSVRTKEWATTNWVGLILQLWRGQRLIAEESLPTHPQVQHDGEWNTAYVTLLLPGPLLPGDSVQFVAGPCYLEPPILMDDAALRVMQ